MKIGVVGASGYAGGELLRLLSKHPKFQPTYISAGSNAGELITSVHPHLTQYENQKFDETTPVKINQCELVFIALPHGESAKLIANIDSSVKIVDLGADFRLSDAQQWVKYYGGEYAGKWHYGIPELVGLDSYKGVNRVANPGCYATAISLAVAPVIKYVDHSDIVVVAASGTTGAGRSAKINLLGSEVMGSLTSYKFGGVHQHTPEIEECLSNISDQDVKISFTPVLAPMPRGILATVTSKLIGNLNVDDLRDKFEKFYENSKFVKLLPVGSMPMTSSVFGSNSAHIQITIDSHTNRLVISCAIDNLGKGAAGQAIQNANIIFGLPDDFGLDQTGVR
ncbi:MAG: N-acetyl-gamma-glutamyl-phosphate reductase [Actinomycetes bacterium]